VEAVFDVAGNVVVGVSDVVVWVGEAMTKEIIDEEGPLDPGAV
jgi:hypothetical protein